MPAGTRKTRAARCPHGRKAAANEAAEGTRPRRPRRGVVAGLAHRFGVSSRPQSAKGLRGLRRARPARQRAAHPAAFFLPAADALIRRDALNGSEALITCGPLTSTLLGMPTLTGVPSRISLTQDKGPARLAAIAEGLALAGLLDDRDIVPLAPEGGALTEAIGRSLSRLISTRGVDALGWFMLSLGYTDDLEISDEPNAMLKLTEAEKERGLTLGGFRLVVTGAPAAILGRKVLALEKVSRGLGYALFGLLDDVLSATVDVASPSWCLNILDMMGADDWDEEEIDDGMVTTDRFLNFVPSQACSCRWSSAAAERAGALSLSPAPAKALKAGLKLYAAWQEALAADSSDWGHLNDRHEFECDVIRASVLRWSDKDHVVQLFDDYNEQMQNMGDEYTEAPFLAAFRLNPDDPAASAESVKNAALRLSAVLAVVAGAEKLIDLLHTEPRKPRKPRGSNKPLMQVLVDDYNARQPAGLERDTDGRLLTAL